MLTEGQIEATRQASIAFDTIGGDELSRPAAQASLVQFEGMPELAPDIVDAVRAGQLRTSMRSGFLGSTTG
jgi:hypothetical protein